MGCLFRGLLRGTPAGMLDPRFVTEHLPEVKAGLARRGFSDEATLDRLAVLAQARRTAIAETDALREQLNR